MGDHRSRGRFATPAGFPLHDCRPFRGLHVQRERLGFVHRSRTIFCCPKPQRYDSTFPSLQVIVEIPYSPIRNTSARGGNGSTSVGVPAPKWYDTPEYTEVYINQLAERGPVRGGWVWHDEKETAAAAAVRPPTHDAQHGSHRQCRRYDATELCSC